MWKMATGSIVFVGIAPHPPIMVPEVGGEMASEVRGSVEAMRELTRRIVDSGAETVVLISPHAPLEARAFVAYDGPRLRGDFSQFRAPHATLDVQLDRRMLAAVTSAAAGDGLQVVPIEGHALDHGTAVPLYFLRRFGWDGPVVALGYSFLSDADHIRFGACVRRAADAAGRTVSFVASGDLSHRIKRGAPAGYHPDALLFDQQVVAALDSSDPFRIASVDQGLRRLAGECGYRSMLVALGTLEGTAPNCEVLHYEAPFGVGYLVAQLFRAGAAENQ
jgi:MEMO1 family protein